MYTLDQYNKLKSAIAEGVLTVKYFDKEITYRSLDDMLRILTLMKRELFPNNNNGRTYVSYSKGTNRRGGGHSCC